MTDQVNYNDIYSDHYKQNDNICKTFGDQEANCRKPRKRNQPEQP